MNKKCKIMSGENAIYFMNIMYNIIYSLMYLTVIISVFLKACLQVFGQVNNSITQNNRSAALPK